MTTTPAPKGADIELRDLLDDDGENRAVRSFLMLFQQRAITVLAMRNHMELSGWHGCWPEWVNDPANEGHLTKGGAQIWIRHLFSLEQAKSSTSTSQGAKPEPMMYVPRYATNEIVVAIEREIDSQLTASGMDVGAMQRQDGFDVWEAAIGAVDRGGNSGAAPGDALDAATRTALSDALNTTLWLYRRLPHAYNKPPFVDAAILTMAEVLGMEHVPESISERAAIAASTKGEA